MHIAKLSHGRDPDCEVLIRIILQSFLLILLQTFEANGEITKIDRCPSKINWKPIHYYIKISTDIHKNETSFRGQVGIDGVVLQNTNELLLHSKLKLTEAFYTFATKRYNIDLKLGGREGREGALILKLRHTLKKDQRFHLTIKYSGYMNTNPGIYVSYYNSTKGPRPVVSTELEPNGARFVFPCLDLPRFKAKFSIEVARPQSMVVLTNGEFNETSLPDPKVDNQVWDSFHPSPIMSTYLLSIVICDDYQNVSLPRNSSYWFPRESKDDVTFLASETSSLIVNTMETFTEINYTHSKLDHVLIPDKSEFFAGMENWGLITWSYSKIKSASKKDSLITEDGWCSIATLAHEIVHQWLGNLVTCRYWCYIWLNEGIAEFMNHYIINQLFPLTKSYDLFIRKQTNSIMDTDLDKPTHLVNEDECCKEEAFKWSYSLYRVYMKGAAIMVMVEGNILSNGTFRNGIQRYLRNNMYGTVTNKELWGAFQEVIEESSIGTIPEGTTLEAVMDTWTHYGSFPIVHMNRFENGSVAVKQEEYIIYRKDNSHVYWWIPLTYTTKSKIDFSSTQVQEWLSPNGDLQLLETHISKNEWIIFNIQQRGYYKVNYDLKSWEIITEHLINGDIEDIHPTNRASLLNDAFMFAQRGFINYSVALNLTKYLVRENNYFPLKTGEDGLSFLLKEYYRFVFSGIYENVRLGSFNVTDLPSSWLRQLAIRNSCGSKLDHCRKQALQAAESIINEEIQEDQIDPLLRYDMWCYAIKEGGSMVYDYVKNMSVNEIDNTVKNRLVKSLFCAENDMIPSLIMESMTNVIHFKGENSSELLHILFGTPSPVCQTVSYLNDHYDKVTSKIDARHLKNELDKLEIEFLDEECRDKAAKLITKFDKSAKINKYAFLLEESCITNINSWLDEQNWPKEVYSEDNDTVSTNLFLRQDEFNFFELE